MTGKANKENQQAIWVRRMGCCCGVDRLSGWCLLYKNEQGAGAGVRLTTVTQGAMDYLGTYLSSSSVHNHYLS
jgi:hypothetical protein